jgi:hypothetical protein
VIQRRVVWLNYTDVSRVSTASAIALMMVAVQTSETSVYFNDITRRYIAEGCHLQYKCSYRPTASVVSMDTKSFQWRCQEDAQSEDLSDGLYFLAFCSSFNSYDNCIILENAV